jgi:hypothetical protein
MRRLHLQMRGSWCSCLVGLDQVLFQRAHLLGHSNWLALGSRRYTQSPLSFISSRVDEVWFSWLYD